MIAQQYVTRISVRLKRCPDIAVSLSTMEGLFKGLAMTMMALVFVVGCIKESASLLRKEVPAAKVTVRQGDTLWKYASTYGDKDRYILSRVEEIARLNNLPGSTPLQPGMELLIPK